MEEAFIKGEQKIKFVHVGSKSAPLVLSQTCTQGNGPLSNFEHFSLKLRSALDSLLQALIWNRGDTDHTLSRQKSRDQRG